jgi:hypothetical protein
VPNAAEVHEHGAPVGEQAPGYFEMGGGERQFVALLIRRPDASLGSPLSERIVVDPEVLAGKLTREDILACLSYASYLAHEYKAYPIPA